MRATADRQKEPRETCCEFYHSGVLCSCAMGLITRFTTLEDAYFYFYEAKSTSDTKAGKVIRERHLRAAAILAWVAVDDAMASWMAEAELDYPRNCRGARLFPKLEFIFGRLGSPAPDEREFDLHRDIRNEITHPSGTADYAPTLAQLGDM